jgi:uncharacterized protein YbbC (DUF1343 family)
MAARKRKRKPAGRAGNKHRAPKPVRVLSGLERLASLKPKELKGRRIGILMHQASVTSKFRPALDLIRHQYGSQVKALFGPQHGIAGEKQDNMVESAHSVDAGTGIPIYSLYSETRSPTPLMLSQIDTLIVDLQDVGTRVYTFEWTTALAMEACAAVGVDVIILDRPNPLGGLTVEGNLIRPGYESFVGLYPVPMRHGLTLGEMALLVNERMDRQSGKLKCRIKVIPMPGWSREMCFQDTGLPWITPSPNMPAISTAEVYPGQVLLEGTNLSEGRGTTLPFEIWGAPWLSPRPLLERFNKRKLPGCFLREHSFQPTFHKYEGRVCRGFQIHVTNRARYKPYMTTLALLQDVITIHADQFEWKQPPYEYVTDKLPIDVLTGDPSVREALETGASLVDLEKSWATEIRDFRKEARAHWLYHS